MNTHDTPISLDRIRQLVDRHADTPDAELVGWDRALDAIDHDDEAFEAAVEKDPLMIFRRLKASDADQVQSRRDVNHVRRAVDELRRARALDQESSGRRDRGDGGRFGGLRLAAMLGGILLTAALLFPTFSGTGSTPSAVPMTAAASVGDPVTFLDTMADAEAHVADGLPLVQDVASETDDLIQIESMELSVVVAVLPGR